MNRVFIIISSMLFIFSCNIHNETAQQQVQIDAEDCNCLDNYYWIKETFEKNDAGFEWSIQKKGKLAYQKFCDSIEIELKKAENIYECQRILNDWGKFFRKGHFYVSLNPSLSNNENVVSAEKVSYSLETVEKQMEQMNDEFIGVWKSSPYTIGIVRDTLNPDRKYVGFIIEATVEQWKKGDVKLEIFEKNNKLTSNFYLLDYSLTKRSVMLRSKTELMIGTMKFINYSKIDSEIERKLLASSSPKCYELSENTMILKIPSFNSDQTEMINNEIEQNKEKILSHKNLIIDLRNNGGGSDISWKELIPLIYTNPIKNIWVEYLSTDLNRKHLLQNTSFLQRLFLRGYIKKLEANEGKFVVRGDSVYIKKLDEVLPNPQHVIVVVDESCGSSTEEFLLCAQQSSKVKIYGKQTFGSLDVSNVRSATSPDACFSLNYCVTRTLRPKAQRIDDIGITPDIEINDSISRQKWIEYILQELDN